MSEKRADILNDCMWCHKVDYETERTHWHYCNDCVKICTVCNQVKALFMFDFNFKSAEYKRWKAANCYGRMSKDGHMDECSTCIRTALNTLLVKPIAKVAEKMSITPEMVQLMLDATLGKQRNEPTATERPDTA